MPRASITDGKGYIKTKTQRNVKTNCWEWIGRLSIHGYAVVHKLFLAKKLKISTAHQLSYILYHGDYPRHLFIRHRCHNRKCVNPNHLHLGTHLDNMNDMKMADRASRGENRYNNKFSTQDILIIRKLLREGNMMGKDIATLYNTTPSTISAIKHRQNWDWL